MQTAHSSEPHERRLRLVSRGDGFDVKAIGRKQSRMGDLYAYMLDSSWRRLMMVLVLMYLAINLVFGTAFYALSDEILNAHTDSFADAFFFSVQTFATIGYGAMSPQGLEANILVTIEAMFGFAYAGMVAGLMFAKFSRPTARVMFSSSAVIGQHNGAPHFMFRLANERDNRIVNARAKLTLMRREYTLEGERIRRSYDLKLLRKEMPVLRFTWSLYHHIDKHSPLYGMTAEMMREHEVEIIVSLTGLDETFSQNVHARHSYVDHEILFNARFDDIINRSEDAHTIEIRYDKFHDVIETTTP